MFWGGDSLVGRLSVSGLCEARVARLPAESGVDNLHSIVLFEPRPAVRFWVHERSVDLNYYVTSWLAQLFEYLEHCCPLGDLHR